MSKKHLRDAGISDRTLKIYRREVSLFFEHLEAHGIRIPRSYHALDEQLASYINHLYQEGEAITHGGWVLSALKRFYPRAKKELYTAQQYYTNWARQHVPDRATPITWKILQSFVGLAFHVQHFRLALLYLVGFVFFLRTNELLKLQKEDFAVDCLDGTVVIRLPFSKTSRTAQQAIAHTDVVLARVVSFLLSLLGDDPWVWPFSTTHFRSCLSSFSSFFGVSSLKLVPYSLRRGGATHFYSITSSLDFVVVRGRWKDTATARIYLDDARATLIRQRLSPSSATLLARLRLSFQQLWLASQR